MSPGKSVAGLRLGSTFSEFQATFPPHANTDEDVQNSLRNRCPDRSYHWLDIDRNATGVYALFKDGKIYQMSVHTPRFALSNGVHIDSTADEVRRAYPKGQEHWLVGSGSAVVGGKDLIYWVDEADGVAFELYWNKKTARRLVSGIDIFAAGTAYRPEGCISPPQSWKELKSPSQPPTK
ncbi:hypothetical protein [Granulicella sp. dw_53]|uniref:hypothetical protein n=1 Tax=Granulicella sp. dw_53 TaxID=2719792 RepID=UPI001BD41416|nr:hypothetical protein [Granulicella sp. dw_53]